ncbi:translesion DNA synthesis-associated protein ImuA [Celerinatantimonas diazotrophica]|uniref:Protein ImuA n=1 Tax=Celerinatantimonas diazotrophica TaxID=412034 RepID=A0A4V2PNM9_9GAMM|nr:translesion DNA synthesis-associated protein ImuA [Celerinatantimonas diazotrophica]TCK47701.1 protein ImuA [Celerinatantimonas diazotrophica]CAG9296675.1 Cell division inhibitor SulA [Celerinatantimonas diazotrophica]
MNASLTSMMDQQLVWQGKDWHPSHHPLTTTGYKKLDQQLAEHGWAAASVNEIYVSSPGQGELQLIAPALSSLSEQKRWIIWIAPPAMPNAPALRQLNIDISRILVVHPKTMNDQFWAIEQALQSGSCSVVLGWTQRLTALQLRRLKLAAKRGSSMALLFRPHQERSVSSPANNRIEVNANQQSGTFSLDLFKRDGGWPTTIAACPYQDGFHC